jgi:hypothetical protein
MPGMEKHRENLSTDFCIHLLGGGAAGVTNASITCRLDLVRTWLVDQVILLELGSPALKFEHIVSSV